MTTGAPVAGSPPRAGGRGWGDLAGGALAYAIAFLATVLAPLVITRTRPEDALVETVIVAALLCLLTLPAHLIALAFSFRLFGHISMVSALWSGLLSGSAIPLLVLPMLERLPGFLVRASERNSLIYLILLFVATGLSTLCIDLLLSQVAKWRS